MPPLRISVLVVTYGHAAYIREALASALAQSFRPTEIVVVDDGSTDGTAAAARSLLDARVRVIEERHRGISRLAETYNHGLAACRGDLVAILEGDDRWPRGKLAEQVRAFADPEVIVSHGPYAVIGATGATLRERVAPVARLPEGRYDALPFHLLASYVMPLTSVIRRETLASCDGFRQLGQTPHWDYPTFLALAERGPFAHTTTVVGEWRKHGSSGTTRLAGRDLEGADLCLGLALDVRERLASRPDLPTMDAIRRSWQDAYVRQVWQVGRILLIHGRFEEARSMAFNALKRPSSVRMRARIALLGTAALLHADLERPLRLLRGRSPLEEIA